MDDALKPFRGIVNGILFSIPIWAILLLIVLLIIK